MLPCYTLQKTAVLRCSICSWGTQANRDEPSHSDHAIGGGGPSRTDQAEINSNFKSSSSSSSISGPVPARFPPKGLRANFLFLYRGLLQSYMYADRSQDPRYSKHSKAPPRSSQVHCA